VIAFEWNNAKAQRQFYARRGPITMYVREGPDSERHAVAHLVHDKVKSAYLQVTGFGFEFDELCESWQLSM
jgi:hypothetical protein